MPSLTDEFHEPSLRVLRVCVLICEAFGGTNTEVSFHRTHDDAVSDLHEWCYALVG